MGDVPVQRFSRLLRFAQGNPTEGALTAVRQEYRPRDPALCLLSRAMRSGGEIDEAGRGGEVGGVFEGALCMRHLAGWRDGILRTKQDRKDTEINVKCIGY